MSREVSKTHCRILALEAVLKFFNKPNNLVGNIKSTSALIAYLEKNNLKCIVFCPFFFIISPRLWGLFWKHRVSANFFLEISNTHRRKAIIHFLSAHQLYDIEDLWTHYVCEFFADTYIYFDPYLDQLAIDYPTKKNYVAPSSMELLYNKSIKILIFEPQ
ncbi:MAG: hypothetical protein M3Q99_07130 [Acidobacteriota bacterium]|nr:hypothetical protein [Acidobacteriota bacterium]